MFGLLMLYRITEGNTNTYVHFQKEITSRYIAESDCADFAKMRFWKLIEKKEGEKDDGNPNSGFYRITKEGVDFLQGNLKIHRVARIFNNQFYGFSGELVSFADCAKDRFDYSELMN